MMEKLMKFDRLKNAFDQIKISEIGEIQFVVITANGVEDRQDVWYFDTYEEAKSRAELESKHQWVYSVEIGISLIDVK